MPADDILNLVRKGAGAIRLVGVGVEFNAPLDTTWVISEAGSDTTSVYQSVEGR